MTKRLAACLVISMLTALLHGAEASPRERLRSVPRTIEVAGLKRTLRLYVPSRLKESKPCPLLFVFHGGGGNGAGVERLTRFSPLAEREGFIVVYPDGMYKTWNDGRASEVSRAHREQIDDVSFVAAMIDALAGEYSIDAKRIFATGISNGGIFSHYLAAHLSSRIAAIAPVIGGIADPFHRRFKPEQPVSVLILQGTEDPLTPYHGGEIAKGRRGRIIDTVEAARMWAERNGCSATPGTGRLPNRDPRDGCTVTWTTWSPCREGSEVTLYSLEGAGHTWPGGTQYLPQFVVGSVCREFDATERVWEFFKRHPKP